MKRVLLLSVAVLSLAACGPKALTPAPAQPKMLSTRDFTFSELATSTTVTVRPKHLGTRFCYTDSRLNGVQVCNNLVTGKRKVDTGQNFAATFTALEDGAVVNAR